VRPGPAANSSSRDAPGRRPAGWSAFLGEGREVGLGPGRVSVLEGRVLVVAQPGQRLIAEADAEQARSMSAMCRTMPSNERFDGGQIVSNG
jgi:hypothetical protein